MQKILELMAKHENLRKALKISAKAYNTTFQDFDPQQSDEYNKYTQANIYCSTLKNYPEKIVCGLILNLIKKNKFFPTVAEIISKVKEIMFDHEFEKTENQIAKIKQLPISKKTFSDLIKEKIDNKTPLNEFEKVFCIRHGINFSFALQKNRKQNFKNKIKK